MCIAGTVDLMFTYEVEWLSSQVRWASRWDTYLAMSDVQIHWFSIINSVVVVFFLAGLYHIGISGFKFKTTMFNRIPTKRYIPCF